MNGYDPKAAFLQIRLSTSFSSFPSAKSLRRAQLFVHQPIAGDHPEFMMSRSCLAPEFPAGAFQNQSSRRNVPKADAAFNVDIQSARGHIRQGEGRGTKHPNFSDTPGEPEKIGQGAFHMR